MSTASLENEGFVSANAEPYQPIIAVYVKLV